MENEIENLKETIKNLKGVIENKEKYNDDVCKHLSKALSDVRKLQHEKSILLAELEAEIKKRIELQSKLFFFEEDSKDLPF